MLEPPDAGTGPEPEPDAGVVSEPTGTLIYENDFSMGFGRIGPSESVLTSDGVFTDSVDRIDQICSGGRKWSLADPLGGTNMALRVFQAGDDSCLTGRATKPKHRAQFRWMGRPDDYVARDGRLLYALDEHHWLAWRIFFPTDFPTEWLEANGAQVAHWSFQRETRIIIRRRGSTPIYRIQNKYNRLPGGIDEVSLNEVDVPMPRGRWIDVVIHVLRKQDDTGIVEVWIDGDKVADWHGVRTASATGAVGLTGEDGTDATQKMGIYWGTRDRPVDFTLYFDELRYARGPHRYDVVDPSRYR